jgi:serine protease Do
MNRSIVLTVLLVSIITSGLFVSPASGDDSIASLRDTAKAFTQVAGKATGAVVSIKVKKYVQTGSAHGSPMEEEFFEFFFGPRFRQRGQKKQERPGLGSGFIVSTDGYIMTNNHVVGDADEIKVTLKDGREFDGEIIGTDPRTDVAVIKIDGKDLPVIELGDSDALKIGEWVIAVGNPFGLAETVTVGVVSAKGRSGFGITRNPTTGEIGYEDFIQTDAAINPGNSGGPLLDIDGKVIGINTFIFSQSGGYMGIGFAIPINMAKSIKNQLIESGRVTRGYLGIYMDQLDAEKAEFFGLDEISGVIITSIAEDSPAEKAKLKEADIILKINDKKIEDTLALRNFIAFVEPGTEVSLLVYRDGSKMKIKAKIEPRPDDEFTDGSSGISKKLGLQVQDINKELARQFGYEIGEGVIVSSVTRGSQADIKGIKAGMVILSVDRIHVGSVKEFNAAILEKTKNDKVLLLVQHGRFAEWVVLRVE